MARIDICSRCEPSLDVTLEPPSLALADTPPVVFLRPLVPAAFPLASAIVARWGDIRCGFGAAETGR